MASFAGLFNDLAVVTGSKELDAKLQALLPALQKKLVRQALRKSAYRAKKAIQEIIKSEAHDTGTLEKNLKVKALKRSRVRVGVGVCIDRDKLFADYEEAHGKPPHPAKGRTAPFYYPSVIEFGDKHHHPVRPMRRGLYDHEEEYKRYFKDDLEQIIAENNAK